MLLTKGLSDVLQAKELDLAAAVDLVNTTRDTLQDWRNDSASWRKLWTDVVSMMKDNGLSMELPRKSRRRLKQSTRIDEFVIKETVGARRDEMEDPESEDIDLDTHYRISIYNATLDQVIGEMNRHFSVESRSLMTAAIVRVAQDRPHSSTAKLWSPWLSTITLIMKWSPSRRKQQHDFCRRRK